MNLNGSGQTNSGILGSLIYLYRESIAGVPGMSQHANPNETYDLKQALRRTLKERRAALTAEDRRHHHQRIAATCRACSPNENNCGGLPFTWPPRMRLTFSLWIDSAHAAGLQLFAPVVGAEAGQMDFYPLRRRTTIRQGRFGLREPEVRSDDTPADPATLDAALVPLLGFDDQGHRLGMGGGYYDRYFCSVGLRPWIVGIAYEIQQSEKTLPTETWDIRLDAVVTETGSRIF